MKKTIELIKTLPGVKTVSEIEGLVVVVFEAEAVNFRENYGTSGTPVSVPYLHRKQPEWLDTLWNVDARLAEMAAKDLGFKNRR